MTEPQHWHLDKRVPIAIIFAIAVQTAGAIWWASAMSSNVEALRAADARLERTAEEIRAEAAQRETRLRVVETGASRMEGKLESIAAGIDRLNEQIDRLLEQRP